MPTLARQYAVIMGSLAMTVTIVRAVKEMQPADSALWAAMGLMLIFAVLGLAVGWLADAVIVESVRAQAEAQLQSLASHAAPKTETSRVP